MKKKRIVLISVIASVLVAVCLLYFFVDWDGMAVSYMKEEVSLDNIKPNETVLVMELVSFTSYCHEHYILIINKNKQVKYVDFPKGKEPKELLLNDYDAILKDKKIAFAKQKLEISNEMLSKIININNYKLKTQKRLRMDWGSSTYYSVCGSGKNRKMVIMKETGNTKSQGKNQKINKLCDDIGDLTEAVRR